jgi:hypothetical protein
MLYAELRQLIAVVLSQYKIPLKAREIARIIQAEAKSLITKSDINSLLYKLEAAGVVKKDSQFRWTITGLETPTHQLAPPAVLDALPTTKHAEVAKPELSARIGHWNFILGHTKSNNERWRFECVLCGYQISHVLFGTQFLLPLTGKMRGHRRRHDKKMHPELVREQSQIEKEREGHIFPIADVGVKPR